MPVNVLFSARAGLWENYEDPLLTALNEIGVNVNLSRNIPPCDVDYVVFAPNGPVSDFTPYTRTKAVLGLWAGVESITGNTTLTQPLARMVDPGMTEGMAEWVAGHVLRHHLGMDVDICRADTGWQPHIAPLARDRQVGVMGLGALGSACAKTLAGLNFDVLGWSRSAKDIAGVETFSGPAGLDEILRRSEILVLLLPLTDATGNILNARTLGLLPGGAIVINPGRGPLIDDAALLEALKTGQIAHATLDVFRTEPLPPEHPFWAQKNVTVTPHIASETRPISASKMIAENIRRGEMGEPFLHLVDRKAGY
ncbi:MAG: glyoxylate/hydroxypyruvate reductase A [Rhodobacteraceae bacterium]|nr:glyoxylate/hydroxypyruvate reductase A [Paracoccaceae bacterium]